MACISRFATAILSGETELALGTIRVNLSLVAMSIVTCSVVLEYFAATMFVQDFPVSEIKLAKPMIMKQYC